MSIPRYAVTTEIRRQAERAVCALHRALTLHQVKEVSSQTKDTDKEFLRDSKEKPNANLGYERFNKSNHSGKHLG